MRNKEKIEYLWSDSFLGKAHEFEALLHNIPPKRKLFLCLCKLSLNVKMFLDSLMSRTKKDNNETYESGTNFIISQRKYKKEANG